MVKIKDLPGGEDFRATLGAGSFSRRLTSATRAGALSNLKDNQSAIIRVLKKNESAIRRGAFDRLRQLSAWNTVKKLEGDKLSKDDAKEIKQLFRHLGEEAEKQEEARQINMDKALAKDDSFSKERDQEAKARLLGKITRFDRERTGGEARLNFASQPEDIERESMSMTGQVLSRRFNPQESRLKARLPRYRVDWRKEKEKRVEVADIERELAEKMSKKPGDKSANDKTNVKSSGNQAIPTEIGSTFSASRNFNELKRKLEAVNEDKRLQYESMSAGKTPLRAPSAPEPAVQEAELTGDNNYNNQDEEIKEQWTQAAEQSFGINDFDVYKFKRAGLNKEAVNQAFAEGHDWEYIYSHPDKFSAEDSYEQANLAFAAMQELESEAPGSVKNMHENFGISNFQRYPKEMLLKQAEPPDPNKGVGLMAFAASDWNGSFDDRQKLWQKIYNERQADLNFRIIECKNKMDFARQLVKAKQDFNKNISLLILSAHGNPDGFSFGEGADDSENMNKEDMAQLKSRLADLFEPKAQMIANACSAGAMQGWLQEASRGAKISAVGPDKPAAILDVDFVGKEIVPKYEENDTYSGYKNGFLLSKKENKTAK